MCSSRKVFFGYAAVIFSFSVLLIGCASTRPPVLSLQQETVIADTISKLTDYLAEAISSRDATRIAQMFERGEYPKYVSDGLVIPQNQMEKTLTEFYSGLEKLDFRWNRKQVEVLSADVATVTSWTIYTGITKNGQQFSERAVFTHLYARRDGIWRLISSHKSIQK
jgi:uncharacterized protein (TIGR02246 family)